MNPFQCSYNIFPFMPNCKLSFFTTQLFSASHIFQYLTNFLAAML
jgi:hypothetical protein